MRLCLCLLLMYPGIDWIRFLPRLRWLICRADGLSLRPFFDHSIGGLDLHWGITNGYLVDIHAYAVTTATDIGSVPSRLQVSGSVLDDWSCLVSDVQWMMVGG